LPTPVSALLHAATMVTAGVYLLIRLSPIFSMTPITLTFISIIGALTAFFAASSGLVQNDVKRVIAYSTSSQLGYYNILLYSSFNNSNNISLNENEAQYSIEYWATTPP
jgi:NADH-quinone oxidoreductase subunit L